MVLLAFLAGLAVAVAATVFCVLRGVGLWRQAKRAGAALGAEVSRFEERSARTERLLAEADRANADLQLALERLRVSRARLKVLQDAVEGAKQRTRWLRAFLPA